LYTSDGALAIGTASTTNTAADIIFHTGGTTSNKERMRIDQAGLIGIGTTTPSNLLTVFSDTAPQFTLSAGSGISQFAFRNAGGNLYIATTTIAGTSTSTVSALSILNNGRIGIGTDTPSANLAVRFVNQDPFIISSSSATTLLVNRTGSIGINTATPGTDLLTVHQRTTGVAQGLRLENAANSRSLSAYIDDNNYANLDSVAVLNIKSDTSVFVTNSAENYAPQTSPAVFSPASALGSQIALVGGSNVAQWAFRNAGGNFYLSTTTVAGTSTTTLSAFTILNNGKVGISSSTPSSLFSITALNNTDQIVDVSTQSGTSALHITSAGNVGLGSTSPKYKLAVVGSAYFDGGTLTAANIIATSTLTVSSLTGCNGVNQVLQTDISGKIVCGAVNGSVNSAAGWVNSDATQSLSLATSTYRIGLATSTPYAKLSVLSGNAATTTLALVPFTGQTANILDIYDTFGVLDSVFTASGKLGIGTTSPSKDFSLVGDMYLNTSSIYIGTTTASTASTTIYALGTTTIAINSNSIKSFSIQNLGTSTPSFNIGTALSANGKWATTSISFFGATTTGLFNAQGVGVRYQNNMWIGDGTATTSVNISRGSLCVDNDGFCYAASTTAGNISARRSILGNADLAEMYLADEAVEPGDVVAISYPSKHIRIASSTDMNQTLGIISTDPGLILGADMDKDTSNLQPVALAGRIPTKVTTGNGPIKAGDYITLSSTTPGVAVKAITAGAVLGQALEDYNGVGIGKIEVFVKNTYFAGLSGLSLDELNLNLLTIASTTATTTAESQAFSTAFFSNLFNKLIAWFGDTANGIQKFFAKEVHTDKICVGDGSAETCLTKAQLDALLLNAANGSSGNTSGSNNNGGDTGSTTPSGSGDVTITPVDTSAPVITVTGNNPAQIPVGVTYSDFGATVLDTNADGSTNSNLGLHFSVDGQSVNDIILDTSTSTTYTIVYSAVDGAGNWGYATRTIEVLNQ
jgi:hypothetical protein